MVPRVDPERESPCGPEDVEVPGQGEAGEGGGAEEEGYFAGGRGRHAFWLLLSLEL